MLGGGVEDAGWCVVAFASQCYIGLTGAALCRLPGLLHIPYVPMIYFLTEKRLMRVVVSGTLHLETQLLFQALINHRWRQSNMEI